MTQKNNILYSLLLLASLLSLATILIAYTSHAKILFTQLLGLGGLSSIAVALLAISQLKFSQTRFGLMLDSMTWQTGFAALLTCAAVVQLVLPSANQPTSNIEFLSIQFTYKILPLLYFVFWWLAVRGKPMKLTKTLYPSFGVFILLIIWQALGMAFEIYPLDWLSTDLLGAVALVSSLIFLIFFWLICLFYWVLAKYTVPLYV